MFYRVLLVDDYEPWRRFVRAMIEDTDRWRIVGEASNGLEAVQQVRALKPDLILLDVGLPVLNGFEAARQILARDLSSRILFLTEQRSAEMAEAALRIGARGYLLKTEAASRLLLAMETVVNDGWFLSSGLARRMPESAYETATSTGRHHEAAFSFDESSLVEDYARFGEATLKAGKAFVFVGGANRCVKLEERLQRRGVALAPEIAEGRYRTLDVAETLSRLMVDGSPHEGGFREVADALIADIVGVNGHRSIAVCGECAPELWRRGYPEAAIQLEHLWDELARRRNIDILCGYLLDTPFFDEEGYAFFQRICTEHSTVHLR